MGYLAFAAFFGAFLIWFFARERECAWFEAKTMRSTRCL